jgi:hypothetical protein
MSEIDHRKLCLQFKEKLSKSSLERIERKLNMDFDEALKEKPKDLLLSILQDVHTYYVSSYEMAIELKTYLEKVHGVARFSLALSENYDLNLSDKIEDAAEFVSAFYTMTKSIGFADAFIKQSKAWWENEL